MNEAEKQQKLKEIGKLMARPGANMKALEREVDKILGMPSEPEPDPVKVEWEKRHGRSDRED